ncbi:hypothetical protein CSKR_113904 [Clonorchis sinensis]|uniref:Uncharacterized protein n=1 Tax=Clonorchis sinensis TaxID=79923 RepID=A0A3R7C656_CLOSI|nr:hypothetical protein CSKR_113904 [Clonorchis sinensis]
MRKTSQKLSASPWFVFSDCTSTRVTLHFMGAKCIPKYGMTWASISESVCAFFSSPKMRTISFHQRLFEHQSFEGFPASVSLSHRPQIKKERREWAPLTDIASCAESFEELSVYSRTSRRLPEYSLTGKRVKENRPSRHDGGQADPLVVATLGKNQFFLKMGTIRNFLQLSGTVSLKFGVCCVSETGETAQWLGREFTDRKVRGSNPTSASQLPLSTIGQPGSIQALVLPSGGIAARHRKGVAAERLSIILKQAYEIQIISVNVALSSITESALLDWISVNSRHCAVRLSNSVELDASSASEHSDAEDTFYKELSRLLFEQETPKL